MNLREISTGSRLQRWTKDESKLAGEQVEIDFYDDNNFYIFCSSELGMHRIAGKWRNSLKLDRLDTFFSENLKKWVVAIELKGSN